ncbi:MAG: VOC family protein [Halobacteria archaeon]
MVSKTGPIRPLRIGHVVLRVRDLKRSTEFYTKVLGFRKVADYGGRMSFFTATGENHHDLALMEVGPEAPAPSPGSVGLYHIAIRLPDEAAVRAAYRRLVEAGADVVGASDHGVSKSVYLRDPDGIEIELYADVPGWEEKGESAVATIRPWDPE